MMLTTLPPADYQNVSALCAPLDIHLAVTAMLAGETPAQISVDDPDDPGVVLLIPELGHRIYLAGTPGDEQSIQQIRQTLLSSVSSQRNEGNPYEFLIYYASPLWESSFPALCQGMALPVAKRCYYEITHTPQNWQTLLSANWKLRHIDAMLLADQRLQFLPELIEEVHSESPSLEDFLSRKFGFCIQEASTLIGWCLSEYNHADRCEIGIETMPAYRRSGVAFITAAALIDHAFAQGITRIGWHCWSHNVASRALANKLGGILTEYPTQPCRMF
jgi:RimJ/RimL family protein N-acetyltransferase